MTRLRNASDAFTGSLENRKLPENGIVAALIIACWANGPAPSSVLNIGSGSSLLGFDSFSILDLTFSYKTFPMGIDGSTDTGEKILPVFGLIGYAVRDWGKLDGSLDLSPFALLWPIGNDVTGGAGWLYRTLLCCFVAFKNTPRTDSTAILRIALVREIDASTPVSPNVDPVGFPAGVRTGSVVFSIGLL